MKYYLHPDFQSADVIIDDEKMRVIFKRSTFSISIFDYNGKITFEPCKSILENIDNNVESIRININLSNREKCADVCKDNAVDIMIDSEFPISVPVEVEVEAFDFFKELKIDSGPNIKDIEKASLHLHGNINNMKISGFDALIVTAGEVDFSTIDASNLKTFTYKPPVDPDDETEENRLIISNCDFSTKLVPPELRLFSVCDSGVIRILLKHSKFAVDLSKSYFLGETYIFEAIDRESTLKLLINPNAMGVIDWEILYRILLYSLIPVELVTPHKINIEDDKKFYLQLLDMLSKNNLNQFYESINGSSSGLGEEFVKMVADKVIDYNTNQIELSADFLTSGLLKGR